MRQMTFGADPEFFLATEDGQCVPVCGWLGGTKDKHIALDRCEVHEDGCAAEITIPPRTDPGTMVYEAQRAASVAVEYASQQRRTTLHMVRSPFVLLSPEVLQRAGQSAVQFGCSPEYDSYNGGTACERVTPEMFLAGKSGAYRYAGGHIHIGYHDVAPSIAEYVVAMLCDAAIGLSLVAYGEKQGKRRHLYGSPGRFRPTKYGVEYRVPCNQWLYDQNVAAAVSDGLTILQEVMHNEENEIRAKWNAINWIQVRSIIGAEDAKSASRLLGELF